MYYFVYDDNECVFETENDELAFQMASNINEDGGCAYVESIVDEVIDNS